MSESLSYGSAHADAETFDVFVSYAHADNEVPEGADQGWVTTLVEELQKVLRRKLGGAGARVWTDHRLAANQEVTEELLAKVTRSSTLLLVMSPGYVKSDWCQRELATYASRASIRGTTQSVFPIEIEPVDRERWPAPVKSLTPTPFWYRKVAEKAPRLAGFPKPEAKEDSLYWTQVNELAHLIAQRLGSEPIPDGATRMTCVAVAETTDDLDVPRQSIISALRQRGDVIILPAMEHPRSTENDFLASVRQDLAHAALFVQLLGPYLGKKPWGSDLSFVALQSREALRRRDALRVMQWRSPELDLETVSDGQLRELLAGEKVSRLGFEEFRRSVLQALDDGSDGLGTAAAPLKQIAPVALSTQSIAGVPTNPAAAETRRAAEGLSLYLQAAPEDRSSADQIAEDLAGAGATVQLSPEPTAGQTFLHGLMAQEEALRMCDGVLLVYGLSPVTAISNAFLFARRVFGVKRPGVWSAILDLPPLEKQPVLIRSPNLATIECRQGFELGKLQGFFDSLRQNAREMSDGASMHA